MNTVLLTDGIRDNVIQYLNDLHIERINYLTEGPENWQLALEFYHLVMPRELRGHLMGVPEQFKYYRNHVLIDGIEGDDCDNDWLYGTVRLNFDKPKVWAREGATWTGSNMRRPTVLIRNEDTEGFIHRLTSYARLVYAANETHRSLMDDFRELINERMTTVNELLDLFPFAIDGLSVRTRNQLERMSQPKPINPDVVSRVREYFAPPLVHRKIHGSPLPL